MKNDQLSVGFIGFGEAGFHIAAGLREAGVQCLLAYDVNAETKGLGEKIRERADASEVNLADSSESLARRSGILFSTVTANEAVRAAEQTAPFLRPHHLYADLNSVSPDTKRAIALIVSSAGARFVEAAVMAPVPPYGHRVPMLLGGEAAEEFAARLTPYGMRLEVISLEIGVAIAVK